MSERIQVLSPADEKRLAENVGKYKDLSQEHIVARQKAESSERALKDCATEIVDTFMKEWWLTNLSERFSIRKRCIEIEEGFANLYFMEIYDNELKITITPEVFHKYGRSKEVEAFLEKFIECFRKRTNKVPISMISDVSAPRYR